MTGAIDDLSDAEIKELAVKLRAHRVGNRWQIALTRWLRAGRRLELCRFRARWARKFNEYECVGGPLDGAVRPCAAYSRYYTEGGYYSIDHGDMRLHFHQAEHVPNWRRNL